MQAGIEWVVCDAREDCFLSHDVLHSLALTAAAKAAQQLGRALPCYEFPLERAPDECSAGLREQSLWLHLDDQQLQNKLAAAKSFVEVRVEVDEMLRRFGTAAFATECIRPIAAHSMIAAPAHCPEYEFHGERLVATGVYERVVRYEQHVLPLMCRLAELSSAFALDQKAA